MAIGFLLVITFSIATARVTPESPKFLLVYPTCAIRYFYGPSVMFLLLIMANIEFMQPGMRYWKIWLGVILLLIGLCTGIAHYRSDIDQFRGKNWPSWSREIARWQANPAHEILIWPPPWKMKLVK